MIESAIERRTACGAAIEKALREYRCQIVPYLGQEQVGASGVLIRPQWGLMAMEEEPAPNRVASRNGAEEAAGPSDPTPTTSRGAP